MSCFHLVPLEEVLAEVFETGAGSRKVRKEYLRLIERGGSEFRILMDLPEKEMRTFMEDRLVEGIRRIRQGLIRVRPGYDGVYGQVKIFEKEAVSEKSSAQMSLF
jgi:PHP family Zn ribbon phosphoesterase